jgi:hypothetical protein
VAHLACVWLTGLFAGAEEREQGGCSHSRAERHSDQSVSRLSLHPSSLLRNGRVCQPHLHQLDHVQLDVFRMMILASSSAMPRDDLPLYPLSRDSHSHSHRYTHTHTHTRTHTDTHAHTHAHRHTRTHTRTHARTHAHTHARTHTHTHTHTHAHTHTHTPYAATPPLPLAALTARPTLTPTHTPTIRGDTTLALGTHSQANTYLRMSSRLEGVKSKIESALTMQSVRAPFLCDVLRVLCWHKRSMGLRTPHV